VRNCTGHGLYLAEGPAWSGAEFATATVSDNVATGNAFAGIKIAGEAVGGLANRARTLTVASNVAKANGQHGFELDWVSSIAVTGNTVEANGYCGIAFVVADNASVTGNVIRNNGRGGHPTYKHGLMFDGSSEYVDVLVANNLITDHSDNARLGIRVSTGGGAIRTRFVVRDNQFANNTLNSDWVEPALVVQGQNQTLAVDGIVYARIRGTTTWPDHDTVKDLSPGADGQVVDLY
jgi:parallel beta-helix repeat protein